jgi:hypothetical protein
VRRPRRLRGVDIEARPLPQVIGWIVGHALKIPRGEVSGATMATPCLAAKA